MKMFLLMSLFLTTSLRAAKLCKYSILCPSADWYSACYGSGSTYGCRSSLASFGAGQSGMASDCGCGVGMKINWLCSSTSGSYPNFGNPSTTSGQYCWCQLRDSFQALSSWAFMRDHSDSSEPCQSLCASACVTGLSLSDFRTAICNSNSANYLIADTCPIGYTEEDMIGTKIIENNENCGDGWTEITDKTSSYSNIIGEYLYTCQE
ncbi:MAG: hypothetical protein LBD94_00270 [Rickettsiales bacterium]|jgi:hypothetical protein|nr:hypothetical protein [Rickettsiales bacterium]